MKNTRFTTLPFLIALALAPVVGSAGADDTSSTNERNELVVFGGISLLDASRSSQTTIDVGNVQLPGMGGFGGRFGRPPIPIPPLSVESETSLGSSALFGARYSRLIKDRLALEADLTVAPSHELEARASGCLADVCVGSSSGRFEGIGRFEASLGERNVTAWHYGAASPTSSRAATCDRCCCSRRRRELGRSQSRRDRLRVPLRRWSQDPIRRAGARVDVVDHLRARPLAAARPSTTSTPPPGCSSASEARASIQDQTPSAWRASRPITAPPSRGRRCRAC
jgi:hypothetical protein